MEEYPIVTQMLDSGYPDFMDDEAIMVCPNCGRELYEGEFIYTSLGVCELCIEDFKDKVKRYQKVEE
ncbi:MAG: hypothetical protein WCO84_01230 [bacterium]